MARKKKKGKSALRASVTRAANDGVAPQMSKSKDTLGIQTPSGRIVLETGGKLTPLGELWYKIKKTKWRPRTVPDLDYLNATPQWTKDGLRQFAVRPNGKKVLLLQ